TNPGGIGHGWVKRRFVTNFLANEIYEDENGLTRCFIPSKIYDNPTLMKADPGYVNRLKSLPEKLRQALLEGNWDVFEGQYFTEWSIEKHVCKPFKIPPSWKRYISLDYGFAKPSAIYWYAIDYHEKVHVIWEYYNEQRTYAQLAEIIKLISKGQKIEYLVADPAIWGDKAHHKDQEEGVSGAEVLQDALENKDKGKNIDVVKADNNRNTGWIRFRQYLLNEQFVAFNTCKNFIGTVPDLIHDEHKEEDLDTNGEDHSADSVRYFLMSRSDAPVRKIPEKKITDGYAEELTRMEMGVGTGYMGA
ncbi:hypothetical protein KAX35_02190, partial [candidate division WOR-3 bacterium]|nr:hypothetical protein [candidate division WOR-3 bacterium]